MTSGVVASMARAQASADPAAVITAYEMARNRRDVDTALSYFADDAVINQRSTTFTGKDEVRKFLDGVAARARFIVISDRRVTGNHVSWTERSGSANDQQSRPGFSGGMANPSGFTVNVEAVVQDGKIQSLSYVFGGQVPRPDPALDGRAQLPASVGLATVLAVLLSLLMIASTGIRRRHPTASSLRGRLMQDLQGWSAARQ
jgi:SnoaL-like domain